MQRLNLTNSKHTCYELQSVSSAQQWRRVCTKGTRLLLVVCMRTGGGDGARRDSNSKWDFMLACIPIALLATAKALWPITALFIQVRRLTIWRACGLAAPVAGRGRAMRPRTGGGAARPGLAAQMTLRCAMATGLLHQV